MKTIPLSNKDYHELMALSRELQTQENHSQAFPYFWEAASEKLEIDPNDEGKVVKIYDNDQEETYTAEKYADDDPEFYEKFLLKEEVEIKVIGEPEPYDFDLENEWLDYIELHRDVHVFSENWNQKTDHNPSLFLDDVKSYIKHNQHHLGRNPQTYARSVWWMPKMQKLIEIILRLNPQPDNIVNPEVRRFL